MDKIYLNDCRFYAYHGAMKEQQVLGQIFVVDLCMSVDLKKAGQTDNVEDTVHYGYVYESVKAEVEGTKHALIEHLGQAICDKLFNEFSKINAITIKISKENPPIAGHYTSVSVELERSR